MIFIHSFHNHSFHNLHLVRTHNQRQKFPLLSGIHKLCMKNTSSVHEQIISYHCNHYFGQHNNNTFGWTDLWPNNFQLEVLQVHQIVWVYTYNYCNFPKRNYHILCYVSKLKPSSKYLPVQVIILDNLLTHQPVSCLLSISGTHFEKVKFLDLEKCPAVSTVSR